ncbi:Transposase IS4 [Fragilaria crotonensis]|nr:Transposase IS4 [Fragilaria crotonensis]
MQSSLWDKCKNKSCARSRCGIWPRQCSSSWPIPRTTFIVADFFFGDNEVKRGKLNIRSVKAVECSALHEELKVILQQRENPIAVASPAPAVAQEANVGVQEQQSPQAAPARRDDHSSSATTPSSVRTAMAVGTTATPTSAAAGVTQQITNSDESPAALTFHDTQWFEADPSLLEQEINGPVVRRLWSIRNSLCGTLLEQDCDRGDETMSRLDYFLCMFPPQSLLSIVRLTSRQLEMLSKPTTTKGEVLRFFGVVILATKFEFDDRRSLWATTATSKYIPAPLFGKTNLSRNRFDDLWRCIRFSDQPPVRPADMTAEQYRWKLVDGFVHEFNEHRASTVSPSERICVDESISRWYGKGGHWINHGLPMYVAIDRKPENGCEIQCASCGASGIMLRLKLVKTAEEEARHVSLMDEAEWTNHV